MPWALFLTCSEMGQLPPISCPLQAPTTQREGRTQGYEGNFNCELQGALAEEPEGMSLAAAPGLHRYQQLASLEDALFGLTSRAESGPTQDQCRLTATPNPQIARFVGKRDDKLDTHFRRPGTCHPGTA